MLSTQHVSATPARRAFVATPAAERPVSRQDLLRFLARKPATAPTIASHFFGGGRTQGQTQRIYAMLAREAASGTVTPAAGTGAARALTALGRREVARLAPPEPLRVEPAIPPWHLCATRSPPPSLRQAIEAAARRGVPISVFDLGRLSLRAAQPVG